MPHKTYQSRHPDIRPPLHKAYLGLLSLRACSLGQPNLTALGRSCVMAGRPCVVGGLMSGGLMSCRSYVVAPEKLTNTKKGEEKYSFHSGGLYLHWKISKVIIHIQTFLSSG